MTTRYDLKGTLTLVSPVAITMPGSQPSKATDPQMPPSTVLFIDGHGLTETAFMPATSFRGGLRRAAVRAAYAIKTQSGVESPLPLRAGYMNNIGGTRGKGSTGITLDVSVREQVRSRNPLVSLFGAADTGDVFFLQGRLDTGHGIPVEPIPLRA